jgi:cytochrome c oxidase subunit 3
MLFAGFTSAYIVSMGDSFWLKYPLPTGFWISTVVLVFSSLFLELAIRFIKRDNQKMLKLFITMTLLSGISFVYFQFQGYRQLTQFGAHAVNNHIIVTQGRYGDYFELKYNGEFMEVDGNTYLLGGKKMTPQQLAAVQSFMHQFLILERNTSFSVKNYGAPFVLYYNNQPLALLNNKLCTPDGKEIQYVDQMRLRDLAINIRDGRGDFFVKGEIGKDFDILYKGKKLEYKDRTLQMNGRKLSKYLQIKSMEAADTGTSYLYIITFLHLLHIAVSLIYLFRMTIHSFSGRFSATENLSLRVGAIFWHFLGLLWLYLLLFLLFIH